VEMDKGRIVCAKEIVHPSTTTTTTALPTLLPQIQLVDSGSKDLRVQVQVRDVDVEVVDSDVDESDMDSDASTARPPREVESVTDSRLLLLQQMANGKLVEAEARAEGRVSLKSYWTYIRAAGLWAWVFTFVLLVLIRVINIGNQVSLFSLSFLNEY